MKRFVCLFLLFLVIDIDAVFTSQLPYNITAVIIAGVHARERFTTHVASMLQNRARKFRGPGTLVIVPRVVQASNNCWRGNSENVDINRNFPTDWRLGSPDSKFLDYGGPQPLSEPESQLIWNLLDKYKPDVFIDIHSGETAIYTPWHAKFEKANLLVTAKDLVDSIEELQGVKHGQGGFVGGYLAFGTIADTAFERFSTSCVFTFEVYGKETSNCRMMFNPPVAQWHSLAKHWNRIIDATLEICSQKIRPPTLPAHYEA